MKQEDDPEIFRIDQNTLDKEWISQPRFYHKYAIMLADARRIYEQAKADKELVSAELDREVRLNPTKFGVTKITEGVVEQTIILQREYRKAHDACIDAKHEVDVVQAHVDTLDHRKKALEDLVKLFLADYFSKPKDPEGVTHEQMDEMKMRARRKRRDE